MQQQQPNLNVIELINREFGRLIRETAFPAERLSYEWRISSQEAMLHSSMFEMGLSVEEYKKLATQQFSNKDYSLSLFEFATLSNNLEGKSPTALKLSIEKYCELMTEASSHVTYYKEKIKALKDLAQQTVVAEQTAKKASTEGAASNPLSVVKAEA